MINRSVFAINLDQFLIEIRSVGRHSFGVDELKKALKVSDKAIYQALYRAKSKEKLAQIRKGYYAILSPEYIKQGMVPATLFIDDLMRMLHRKYYMGLISGVLNQKWKLIINTSIDADI